MKGSTVLRICLAIIACFLIYLRFIWQPTLVESPSPTPVSSSVSPSPSQDISQSWPLYETQYFSLRHPQESSPSASTSAPDSQEWRVIYMGDIQKASGRTQTELWDGYAVTITRFESQADAGDGARVQAAADRQGIVDACGQDKATSVVDARLALYDAISFTGGCLGTADHYYMEKKGSVYRITAMVERPQDQKLDYSAITASILSTFTIKE